MKLLSQKLSADPLKMQLGGGNVVRANGDEKEASPSSVLFLYPPQYGGALPGPLCSLARTDSPLHGSEEAVGLARAPHPAQLPFTLLLHLHLCANCQRSTQGVFAGLRPLIPLRTRILGNASRAPCPAAAPSRFVQ